MKNILSVLIFSIFFLSAYAQDNTKPTYEATGTFLGKTQPLRDLPVVNVAEREHNSSRAKIIRNRLRAPRKVNENALPLHGDNTAQLEFGRIFTLAPEENFDGTNVNEAGATPPDPTGAVGPNHYVHAANVVIKIFDKQGNVLSGPSPLSSIWQNGVNNGDPIVLYDQLADRWFLSQFNIATNGLLIAISETPDPTGAYFTWEFPLDSFPDYPHYTVWNNAYYLTANKGGQNTYALDREALINGDANPQIVGFTLPGIQPNPNTVFSPEPANLLGTTIGPNTPGYIVYLQDDGWGGAITTDHLKIWEINLDWNDTSNSTISGTPLELNTQPFEATFAPFGTGDVNQPGTNQKIDMIGGVISYMTNYREFGTHNSMIVTFNVDVNGNDRSGVRWFELRNDDATPWSIFQEGTYAPNDGLSRFMGSAAIDAQGNIGLAFNIAGDFLPAGIRYTGRFSGDPLGQMTVAETVIQNGMGVQTNTNRFGDYSHLTMDVDNFTFWHTAEYFASNNLWTTKVASFRLSSGFENDIGISNIITPNDGVLSANETVQVTFRNYGTVPQSNFNIELRVEGNLVATEVFSGTIAENSTADFTFAQQIDLSNEGQTYEISATTTLGTDQFILNDEYTKNVTHLFGNDVGVTSIDSPTTGEGLGSEVVSVTVRNFGANAQSDIDVSYSINGQPAVTETIPNTINPGEEFTFNFTQEGDFSQLGDYTIFATTVNSDQNNSNNSSQVTISNDGCSPLSDCSFGDGITKFQLGTIDNETSCSNNGFGDFTDLNTTIQTDTTIDVTVASGFDGQHFSVFIDFNDNFVFEENELVITDVPIPVADTDVMSSFTIADDPGLAGTHLLRVRASWVQSDPTSADACVDFTFGETEDYTVTVETSLSLEETEFNNSDFSIYPIDDDNYEVSFNGRANFGDLRVEVYNTLGQLIARREMTQQGNDYSVVFNTEDQASGVYLVKLFGTNNLSTVKKFIIK
ncbi:GEVED domain-containing protein [Winogradskyella sp. 3972H.M.0a.05]|uniref:GEVED domain-containing protein n=1 Tax=Winogradskyella sp. 3972H.M.0a.05 TaxID=2950277 RepID=UPI003398730F